MASTPLPLCLDLLSDPTRRSIYEHIARHGEIWVGRLVELVDVSQPAVSQHLKKLLLAGLVSERRVGRTVQYRTEPEALSGLTDWLEEYRTFWPQRLQALNTLLHNMED